MCVHILPTTGECRKIAAIEARHPGIAPAFKSPSRMHVDKTPLSAKNTQQNGDFLGKDGERSLTTDARRTCGS
ncbi:hypothetical protein [Novosphingobium album (ex Hu et al. 2023)]|uniref:Transposase n=1 Tax=Novosphingobium album (ex Hu et al. 2023) TaxID=2930093 RepID=A0ABT0B7B0_9SPHN|nr:hypothetical protein [Novosphingobium album (ex Hu et al. 2023)]MCJ2180751.1 hypothetical protein [Novosphingobium album (ex Hu et al. 2023)]